MVGSNCSNAKHTIDCLLRPNANPKSAETKLGKSHDQTTTTSNEIYRPHSTGIINSPRSKKHVQTQYNLTNSMYTNKTIAPEYISQTMQINHTERIPLVYNGNTMSYCGGQCLKRLERSYHVTGVIYHQWV